MHNKKLVRLAVEYLFYYFKLQLFSVVLHVFCFLTKLWCIPMLGNDSNMPNFKCRSANKSCILKPFHMKTLRVTTVLI